MSFTGQNPRFRSTILTDVGLASIGNPASGSHRIINRGGTLQVQDSTGLETAIGAGGTVDRINQTAHGFSVGEALYHTGSAYARGLANAANTSEIVGLVSRVIDANTFELTLEGKVTGLSGLTAGEVYFLSPTVSGGITITEPTVLGHVSLPIGVAISSTVFYVKSSRGAVVGSTNARTEIALANNAVTNVQSVAAYQAGELTGWIEIDGTTDSKFYVAAPFARNGAGTDFNMSPQYIGDTPPLGFSLTVTSGGLIQATLPSIAGFVSAKINYALNVPAVGATFPLSIDSTLVQFSTLKAKDSGGFVLQNNSGTQIASLDNSGNFSVAGNGQGIVPLGAIIAMTTGITGAMAVPASGTASFGWQRADGAAIAGGSTLSGNTPNLTSSVFLRGNTTYGGTGGGTATLTVANIPSLTSTGTSGAGSSHSHGVGTYANASSSVSGSVGGSDGTHTHGDNGHTHNVYNPSASYGLGGASATGDAGAGQTTATTTGFASINTTGSGHGHGFSLTAAAQSISGTSGSESAHTHSISVTTTGTSGSAFNVIPNYIDVIYLIRVK